METIKIKIQGEFRGLVCNPEELEISVPSDSTLDEKKELARKHCLLDRIINFEILK